MIDPFIINYLTQLKGHNNREWFNDNKKDYQKAKELFEVFVTKTIDNLKVIDSTVITSYSIHYTKLYDKQTGFLPKQNPFVHK